MQYSPLLAPVVALVGWTLVIMAWMAVTRFAAFRKMGITLGNIPPGSRGVNLEGKAPDEAQWKSHNYMHLMEQPTIFYALAFFVVLAGHDGGLAVTLAWAYVGLRVVHSLVQVTVNRVIVRFSIFTLATLCLMALTLHAAMVIF